MATFSGEFSILEAAQDLSLFGLDFPDANELYDARVRMIEKFCHPTLPESLVNKAKESLELTKDAHAACEQFRLTAKTVSEQKLDAETLFLIASSILERREQVQGETGTTNLRASEQMAQARRVFLRAVILNLRDVNSNKNLKEILEECLAGVDGLDRITLTMQANLLAAQQKQLRMTAEMLAAVTYRPQPSRIAPNEQFVIFPSRIVGCGANSRPCAPSFALLQCSVWPSLLLLCFSSALA
ncbi:hypothetical protein [Bradyrhizobium sp. NC92]|uniref:hypothetical protein n=1 Tax=Bradyrhizobium sp. (strain NC92) TaxID=55395 RepID=UPI0021AA233D|nr:hypothetical protein [Bradyrhizobium sp. NC92]UWU69605.1 hypothetical protein N2602_03465 [Bradyrhizobium sp. NC92]